MTSPHTPQGAPLESPSPWGFLCETASRRNTCSSPSSEGEMAPDSSGVDGGVPGRRRSRLGATCVSRHATPPRFLSGPPPLKRGRYGAADARGFSQRNPWGRGTAKPEAQNLAGKGETRQIMTFPDARYSLSRDSDRNRTVGTAEPGNPLGAPPAPNDSAQGGPQLRGDISTTPPDQVRRSSRNDGTRARETDRS